MMKALTVTTLTTYLAQAVVEKDKEFEMISELQVNQRTLLNQWNLWIMYSVDAEESRDASQNILSITTILKNDNVKKDLRREI